MAIAAVCVQAIWTVSAPSISSFRRGGRDHREGGIHGCFRNSAKRRTSRSLNLEQRGVHEIARRRAKGFVEPLPPVLGLAIRRIDFLHIGPRPTAR